VEGRNSDAIAKRKGQGDRCCAVRGASGPDFRPESFCLKLGRFCALGRAGSRWIGTGRASAVNFGGVVCEGMSTISEQLRRLSKSLNLVTEKGDVNSIPPSVLQNAKAIIYAKKQPKGNLSSMTGGGIFVKRLAEDKWSAPVAINMTKGNLYWGRLPRVDRADVIIILQDPEVVHAFELYGQVAFSDETHKLKKGILIEKNEEGLLKFAQALSERVDLLRDDDSVSYGVVDGRFFAIHIENPLLRARDSSNHKFYGTKQANAQLILSGGVSVYEDYAKQDLVTGMQLALKAHFDVKALFPWLSAENQPPNSHAAPTTAEPSSPARQPPQPAPSMPLQSFGSTSSSSQEVFESMPPLGPPSSTGFHTDSGRRHSWTSGPRPLAPGAQPTPIGEAQFGFLDSELSSRMSSMSMSSTHSARPASLSVASRGSSVGGWDSDNEAFSPETVSGRDWQWEPELKASSSGGSDWSASLREPSLPTIVQNKEEEKPVQEEIFAPTVEVVRSNSFDFTLS